MTRFLKAFCVGLFLSILVADVGWASGENTILADPGMAVKDETGFVVFTAQVGQTQEELEEGWSFRWYVNGTEVPFTGPSMIWNPDETSGGCFVIRVEFVDCQSPPVAWGSAQIAYSVIDFQTCLAPLTVTHQDEQGRYFDHYVIYGVPGGGTYSWGKTYGPGYVSFDHPDWPDPMVYFSSAGTYGIALTYHLNEEKVQEVQPIVAKPEGGAGGGENATVTFWKDPIFLPKDGTLEVQVVISEGLDWQDVAFTASDANKVSVDKASNTAPYKLRLSGKTATSISGVAVEAKRGTDLLGTSSKVVVVACSITPVKRGEGLPYSIGPDGSYDVTATIDPSLEGTGHFVQFLVDGIDDIKNGSALVFRNDKRFVTGEVQVLGSTQTKPGYAGRLRIKGAIDGRLGRVCGVSDGFSVCVHPKEIAFQYGGLDEPFMFRGLLVWGAVYNVVAIGDSREKMDGISIMENVTPRTATGYFGQHAPSSYVQQEFIRLAAGQTIPDHHSVGGVGSVAAMVDLFKQDGESGTWNANQIWRFACARCGIAENRDNGPKVPTSGFEIREAISKDANGKYYIHVWKEGKVVGDVQAGKVDQVGENGPWVFSVSLSRRDDLSKGIISQELRQDFANNDCALSNGASIDIDADGKRWFIRDGITFYLVRDAGRELKIDRAPVEKKAEVK
jgi:hypothetical protein